MEQALPLAKNGLEAQWWSMRLLSVGLRVQIPSKPLNKICGYDVTVSILVFQTGCASSNLVSRSRVYTPICCGNTAKEWKVSHSPIVLRYKG